MRVTFLTHDNGLYGANRSLMDLIKGLAAHGVESSLVAPDEGEVTQVARERGVAVAIMPFELWLSKKRSRRMVLWRLRQNFHLLRPLAEQLQQWGTDIVHTNASALPIGHFVARKIDRPHVWHLRECADLAYGMQHDWGLGMFRRVIACANAKIAISEAVRRHILPGDRDDNVHVIYDGVATAAEFDRLHAQTQGRRRDEQPYTFALVGSMHPAKGQDTAIRALSIVARTHPRVRLLIVGQEGYPDYEKQCRHMVGELNLTDRVEFWGHITEPFKAYGAADAVLSCCQFEGMGRCTVEGMAASLPVIGYNGGGTPELIQHERTGLLYRGAAEELAAGMQRLIENPAWARQLGENGWQVARARHTIEVNADQVHRVLQSVVAPKHSPSLSPVAVAVAK